jgi:GDP-L-fucose synthase
MNMSQLSKIFVSGHRGMVGSAIVRQLLAQGHPAEHITTRTLDELDLTNQVAVQLFLKQEKPDQVYLASAKVAQIHANNTYQADFIYQNLMMQANVVNAAFLNGVKRLLLLGSSFIYPRMAQQPVPVDTLLNGTLHISNEPKKTTSSVCLFAGFMKPSWQTNHAWPYGPQVSLAVNSFT